MRLCALGPHPAWSSGPSAPAFGCTMTPALRMTVVIALLSLCLGCHKQTVACSANSSDAGCPVTPQRKRTDAIVHVYIAEKDACTVDGHAVACSEVAKTIRSAHPSDDPTVTVCPARTVTYDAVGSVMVELNRAVLTVHFGCSPGEGPGTS
jgi:biopolymer transport protein ExbD